MDIIPFRGFRYDPSIVDGLDKVVVPPYDVIDAEQAKALKALSPFNMAHITKAIPDQSKGEDGDHVYAAAGECWKQWVQQGAVKQENAPAYYVYGQTFTLDGSTYTRLGLIGALKLAAFGEGVGAHEKTLAGPKADRLNLTRGTRVQIGQIFLLYQDTQKTVDGIMQKAAAGAPAAEVTDDEGVIHRIWLIQDAGDIETVKGVFGDKALFIADGHHRYETSLNFMAEHPELADAKFRMVTIVNTENEGLIVQPTHRLIRDLEPRFEFGELKRRMADRFNVEDAPTDAIALKEKVLNIGKDGTTVFGLYTPQGACLITLKDPDEPVAALSHLKNADGSPVSEVYRRLDVSVLHKLLLEPFLGIDDAALEAQSHVDYVKDLGDAVPDAAASVDSGKHQALFLMNATRPSQVAACAAKSERMPQKSTFFYPKVYSGLVMRALQR